MEGTWHGPTEGCHSWLGLICGAQGEREQRVEPWWVAHPKVAWLWRWRARAREAQSLARGWLCSRVRMSRSAFSR